MQLKLHFIFILLCAVLFLFQSNSYGQPTHNTVLLAHKNDHPTSNQDQYSACWGYVAPNGREYAIIGCQPGTAFYDITDTTNIHEVGFVNSTAPGSYYNLWREMKVYSHYAYIVSEVPNSGIQIVDLQYLPDSIHYLGKFLVPSHSSSHSISQSGPYLYVNGCNPSFGQGVTVLDLTSNPAAPVRRGSWNTKYVHDCRILNDTIWAANIYQSDGGTISIINSTNKDNLVFVNSWVNNPNPGPHNIAITTDRRFALTTDEYPLVQPRELKVWNIQNLNNVTLTTVWQPTGITTAVVHNVEIYGNYAVIAHYAAGIRIVDISNPASPQEVAWYETYSSPNTFDYVGCWGVYMFPSGKVIGSDMQTGLYVIKTTPNVPLGIQNNNNHGLPESFSLMQNYPNPFNPSTTIQYSVPKNAYVTIKVYDVLGKQVALIADEYKRAGNYSVTYDASSLSSGVYYYTLTSEGFQSTKKMILVK
jgi:choice-of-anchor B domain-containing protein